MSGLYTTSSVLALLALLSCASTSGKWREDDKIEFCVPPLTTAKAMTTTSWTEKTVEEVDQTMSGSLEKGGVYRPPHCLPIQRIAILVPYRNQSSHLANFLEIMHPFLQQQNLQYVIVAVQQTGDCVFNKGLLLNAAFLESFDHLPFRPDCFFLHDVDLIPEKLGTVYQCSYSGIKKFSQVTKSFDPKEGPLTTAADDVLAVTPEQFRRVNGYSNLYLGPDRHQQDFRDRINQRELFQDSLPEELGAYVRMPSSMVASEDPDPASNSFRLDPDLPDIFLSEDERFAEHRRRCKERIDIEGLSNSRNYYTLDGVEYHNSYTQYRISPVATTVVGMDNAFVVIRKKKKGDK